MTKYTTLSCTLIRQFYIHLDKLYKVSTFKKMIWNDNIYYILNFHSKSMVKFCNNMLQIHKNEDIKKT